MDVIDEIFRTRTARTTAGEPAASRTVAKEAGSRVEPAPWDDRPARANGGTPPQVAPLQAPQGVALAPSVVRTPTARPTPAPESRPAVGTQREAQNTFSRDAETEGWRDSEASDDGGRGAPKREFQSVHVYAGKAALCFNADVTRKEGGTVRMEAAPSIGSRAYDWKQKIAIQFTLKELPIVLAVFMGWMDSVAFKGHGAEQDKGFSFEHQAGGKLFARVWQGGKSALSVPIPAQEIYPVVQLLLAQMSVGSTMGTEAVIAVVRQLSSLYQEAGLGVKPAAAPGGQ